jgi:hypothetical protein
VSADPEWAMAVVVAVAEAKAAAREAKLASKAEGEAA